MQSSAEMLANFFVFYQRGFFASRFRSESGKTVFAHGLFLDEVYYEEACLVV